MGGSQCSCWPKTAQCLAAGGAGFWVHDEAADRGCSAPPPTRRESSTTPWGNQSRGTDGPRPITSTSLARRPHGTDSRAVAVQEHGSGEIVGNMVAENMLRQIAVACL